MKATLHPERLIDQVDELERLRLEEASPRGPRQVNVAAIVEVKR